MPRRSLYFGCPRIRDVNSLFSSGMAWRRGRTFDLTFLSHFSLINQLHAEVPVLDDGAFGRVIESRNDGRSVDEVVDVGG